MPAPVLQLKRGNAGVAGTVPALRPGEPAISLNNFDFFIGIDTSVANNKFFGSHRYWKREDATNAAQLRLVDKDGTNYVAIKAPDTLAGIVTYSLPGTQGSADSVLKNDGSGNLSWGAGINFAGINTFTNTTDNTLGNPDTGAVQIDGGLGVNKNVTIGAGLSVTGQTYFIGTATFYGGQINLGDSDTDDIVVAGEFKSNLIPSDDATYNLGNGSKRWNNASFAGVGTFASGGVIDRVQIGITSDGTIDTSSGNLVLHSATGTIEVANQLNVFGDLDVSGNVYIGGTTVTLRATDVFIENKDIVLGYTTTTTPNDTTANHAGVAIASTEGSPLTSFSVSGINTLPDTYKQMMWFKSGTLGFSTDAFAFNYGVAIGTTTMANGVRLAVGTGVTVSDTSVSATTFYGALSGNASSTNQVKTVTASDTNATYYVTFVDSNNGSAINESVYTDDGIYYNPGTNTFTTQHSSFTGNVNIAGIATLAGNVFLGDSGSDVITVVGVTTFTTSNVYIDNQLFVGGLQITGGSVVGQDITTRNLSASGISTFTGVVNANGGIVVTGITTTGTLKLSGTSGIGITGISASTTLAENSDDYLPTQKAVKAYVDAVDVTLGLNADAGGPSTVNTSQTLTISGTASEVETSVSGQTVTIGLPNDVIVGTSLSSPTIKTATVQHSNGTQAATIDTSGNITASQNLTISGNLYVNGSTTQVNTDSITVEDRTIELGMVGGSAPSSTTTWDLGVLFNYHDGSAKKSALIWEQGDTRFKLGSAISDGGGTGNANPQITVSTFAALEISDLWINNSCTGGSSQVIGCVGSELQLQNITIDAGTF
jgi:hypothetical protein